LPEQYKVKDFGGDAMPENLLPPSVMNFGDGMASGVVGGVLASVAPTFYAGPISLMPGQLGGYIVDATGAAIPNAQVNVTHLDTVATRVTTTDASGRWIVSNLPDGRVRVTATANGFRTYASDFGYYAGKPVSMNLKMDVSAVTDTVTVTNSLPELNKESQRIEKDLKKQKEQAQLNASANVYSLQRRVAGVLPVPVDVPRAGNSYRFVRPLVLDEETKVTFSYKTK